MDQAERSRLEKLLGMLSSSFDGERANAARMISRMAEEKKLTVNELIAEMTSAAPKQQQKPQPKAKPQPQPEPQPDFTDINKSDDLLRMLKSIGDKHAPEVLRRVLTDWEIGFAADVPRACTYDYEMSDKRLHYAEKILRKARRWGLV